MLDSSSPTGEDRRSPRNRALIALAVLIPAVPIIVALALTLATPARTSALSTTSAALVPVTRPLPPPVRPRPRATGALVATVLRPTAMRTSPGGPTLALQSTSTEFGSRVVLFVRRTVPGWLGVVSPLAGNGKLGWIPVAAASLQRVQWKIEVSIAHREVTVLEDGRALKHFKIAVGRPDAPTPTGVFAVTDRLATHDPTGPYGCCILALSAEAPHAIQGWGGGNRIAIHSTPETSSIGLPVSHGCMRLTLPEGRWLIDHVPLGTPTIIRS
ncbi:MAG: L,D-transpeptidase [Solirubrobacteraceae bacterium]